MEARSGDFNPGSYSDVPLYNIQAVAASTGVPSITLRSWERRYGIPEPKRDSKGYRLYSERDIAVTRWLRERVRQGIGISRAVNMLRVIESGDLTQDAESPFDFQNLTRRLLEAVTRLDEAGVAQVISEALMVSSVEDVSLELLQPALYEVGDQWASGRLTVTSEHVASNLIRSHIAQLVRLSPPPLRPGRIVVGSAPGELHDIGPLILSLFLKRRGFNVIYAGASVEPDSLVSDVLRLQPAAVCLSASRPDSANALDKVFKELSSQFPGLLAFGGLIFNLDPELAARTHGTYIGKDARSATANLEAALDV